MATTNVPIEIVLQDPNNPIVPTPDNPSDNPGENTNISVPNTALGIGGQTTQDGSGNNASNIFTGPNATASIVSIVVLVLALATIATLLVRRYQKHKKSAESKAEDTEECIKASKKIVSRKERLATATTATLAILAATVLVGNICMTATNAATDNTTNGTALTTPDKIQIIANRYEDITIVASTKAISYATTDTTFGYKIFMSMAGEDANLYLDGNTDSQYYFAPTTKIGLGTNSWGYSFSPDGEDGYIAMPLADDPLMAQQNTSAVSDEEFTVYYTMKADKDMPFGVYSGEIAYDMEGYNGFPTSLTTMQGMTSEICAAVYTPSGTETVVPTAALTDTRDDKTYNVAKLADGKCWMTQNLDLQAEDIKQGVTLSSENTDNPAANFTLPVSQVDGNEGWVSYDEETGEIIISSVDTPHVYDIAYSGTTYKYCLDYRGYYCAEYGDEIPATELGNLYNWYTATAGTGTYATGSTEEGPFEATGSICPKGWRLANNSNSYESGNYGTTDYSNLLYKYGILNSPTQSDYDSSKVANIYKAPLSLVPTGGYNSGLNSVGVYGSLWSSLAYNSNNARRFNFDSGGVSPWNYNGKVYGHAVRCVAR